MFLSFKNMRKRLFASSSVISCPNEASAVNSSPLNIASRWLSPCLGSQPSLLINETVVRISISKLKNRTIN